MSINSTKSTHLTREFIFHYMHYMSIYRTVFTPKRLSRDIERTEAFKEYKESWEKVQEEGYKNIIAAFIKQIT